MVNNYRKEEEVQETPEMLVQNHDAQMATLDGAVVQTAETLNRVEQNLGWLLNQPNVQADPNAQTAIQYVWDDAQAIATKVTQMDAARVASAAFSKKMWGYHKKLAGDYEELETAVTGADSSNPLVDRLIEDVEQSVYENMDDDMYYSDAMEVAYENFHTELNETMRENTGINDPRATSALMDVLTGATTATESQKDLFRQLLATCAKPGDRK